MSLDRSSPYCKPKPASEADPKAMQRIDDIFTNISSTYSCRFMHRQLPEDGFKIGCNKVPKLMNKTGIQAIFPKKRKPTSIENREHKVYPYLPKDLAIDRSNRVRSGDIAYIPTRKGFMYLAAIVDRHSRSILSRKLSNCMDTAPVADVPKEALERYGPPEIVNTNRGSQYASHEHINLPKTNGIRISTNGKGRSIDSIAVERFFRTLKYDDIYIQDCNNITELRRGIGKYIDFYNHKRFHSALGYRKPMNVYRQGLDRTA